MIINNFKKHLICWGAADQSIVLQPIVESMGAQYDILVDDTPSKISPFKDIELIGGKIAFEKWFSGRIASDYGFIISIGNPYGFVRCELHDYLIEKGLTAVSVCDHSALLDKNISIDDGVQIMKGVIINAHAKIGKQTILNTGSIIEHHTELDKGVEIGPRSTLCGRVKVNRFSWICAGATILPRITIGENSIIGAGAVVTKNVLDNTIVAGVPAKFLKPNKYKVVI